MNLQAEFQAVVLAAGKGSRMPEITAGKPKCLLPVGSKPLIYYPLYKLQLSGFTECIVVVLENQKIEIQSSVDKCALNLRVEYHSIPSNEDFGTADSMRLLHDKIYSNIIVIPCDIITDINLKDVINVFRKHNASIASLFLHPQPFNTVNVPGPKSKYKPERDIVGVDAKTNRLIFLASASDFESEISLPKKLLKKHTNIRMYSTLVDSHIYIMRNWVMKYMYNEENISTLKGEFIPHIIRKQLCKPPVIQEVNPSIINHTQQCDDIFSFSKEDELDLLIRDMSAFNDHVGDIEAPYHGNSVRCFAYISASDTFGVRVNTLPAYCLVKEKIIENWNKIVPSEELILKSTKAEIKSTQVDDRCIIWDGVKLSEKTSFKNSLIGANAEVNSFSRVFNSILMKNVIVKERVALENCIVCDNVVIENGCQLKDCLVGSHHNVTEQSHHSNEVLTDSDRLMEF